MDDRPFGGGPGMVMRVDIMERAIDNVKCQMPNQVQSSKSKIIMMTPQGKPFTQKIAQKLAKEKNLILICGHYEGFDERIRSLVDEEISLGDFVLTGGEIPAMAVVDCVVRLLPGVIGKEASLEEESFSAGLLEYPHYTRPENFKGKKVPQVLLSGNHAEIIKWRQEEAKKRTKKRRPDLLKLNR